MSHPWFDPAITLPANFVFWNILSKLKIMELTVGVRLRDRLGRFRYNVRIFQTRRVEKKTIPNSIRR